MNTGRSSQHVLETEFPALRAKVLELAAGLDRIDRATPSGTEGEHLQTLSSAIECLLRSGPERTEQIQLLFSRAYDDNWRESMEV